MCSRDLLDRFEKINLPALMISHIARIANTSKDHDMGYGFLLTSVFEELGIPWQKKVGFQVNERLLAVAWLGLVQNKGPKHPLALFQDPFLPPAHLPLIPWCRINIFERRNL